MQDRPHVAPAGWLSALAAIVGVTTVGAFLMVFIVTIGPVLIAETGWPEALIGYLYSITTCGAIVFLLAGGPLLRRAGPVRSLQLGLCFAAIAVVLLTVPTLATAVLASFLFGLAFGPTAPVGSDVLHRVAPPNHRSIMFSAKQAGVPLGGVMAGLLLPALVIMGGWRATLIAAALLIVVSACAVQPLRARFDAERTRSEPISVGAFLSLANLLRPLASVWHAPGAFRLSTAGACLSAAQGTWFGFLVTYLVASGDLALGTAGAIFALMQGVAIGGRLLLGWIADRLGSAVLTLRILAMGSALSTFGLAFSGGWPVWQLAALAICAGLMVASWNGVMMAELARISPPGRIGDVAAGAAIVVYIGLSSGPSLVATVMSLTGRFDLGFFVIAVVSLVALAILLTLGGKAGRSSSGGVKFAASNGGV